MENYIIKNGEDFKARLERIFAQSAGDVSIEVEEGRYFIGETVEIVGKKNVKIKALGNVVFDGGTILKKSDIRRCGDEILCIDLKPYGISPGEYGNRGMARNYINSPNELFVNGEPYTVARYPKKGIITYREGDVIDGGNIPRNGDYGLRGAKIKCRDERVKNWGGAADAYLGGLPSQSWADDCIKIKSIDTESGIIETTDPHLYGFAATGHSGWYIVNLLEELTEPGEYYTDIKNQTLYFIPKGNIDDALLQLSVMDKVMLAVENSSDITIEGITFENSRAGGVYIENGDGNKIRNCIFRNLGTLAVQIGQGAEPLKLGYVSCHGEYAPGVEPPNPISREMGSWYQRLYDYAAWDNCAGTNHSIEGCKIYDTGTGGILLSGGNRKKLVPGNNRVYNCEFYRNNRLDKTYKAAVNIMGVGNKIQRCEIYNLPGMAVYMHGNNHIIEYNKIHDVLLEVSDSGAIYMGRDMSEVGNIIRYNFIYSIHNVHKTGLGICAVYFDDWSVYNMVYANYFYDIVSDGAFFFSTVYHTCGGCTSIGNNILIDCFPGLNPNIRSNSYDVMHTDALYIKRVRTADEEDMHGVDITSEAYKNEYPYLYKTYTENYNPGLKFWHNRVYVNQYNDFENPQKLDFRLKDDAEFYGTNKKEYKITDDVFGIVDGNIEIKKIDFENIGLLNKEEQ